MPGYCLGLETFFAAVLQVHRKLSTTSVDDIAKDDDDGGLFNDETSPVISNLQCRRPPSTSNFTIHSLIDSDDTEIDTDEPSMDELCILARELL